MLRRGGRGKVRGRSQGTLIMGHLLLLAIAACLSTPLFSAPTAAREVVDATARHISVPDKIDRVMAAGPNAAVVLYVLAPEKMVGWPSAPRPNQREFLLPATPHPPQFRRP